MKAEIIKRAILPNIPSASGVEVVHGIIYVIGDDSKSLFSLNHNLQLLQTLDLFTSEYLSEERIPKKTKPDLECLTHLQINGYDYLLINGSGSKDNRDKGFLVKLPTKFNKKFFTQEVDFKPLFNLLRTHEEIVADGKLNVEASAHSKDFFVLLNRGNKKGNNAALLFNSEEMQVFLAENPDMLPFPEVFTYELPSINEVPCGFSGACIWEDKLFFTASAEDTEDAVLDGAVTGSRIGWIAIDPKGRLRGSASRTLSPIQAITSFTEGGVEFQGKVESLSFYEKESENKFIAIGVTDSDGGDSELLMVEITI